MSETCKTCQHIGQRYWGGDWDPIHHCGKSGERRSAAFQTSGDFAQDFMNEFRKFYDAGPDYKACPFYETREPLAVEKVAVLRAVSEAGGRTLFKFWSPENSLAQKMHGVFLSEDTRDNERDGFRAYSITKIGSAALIAEERTK
jgi:hypothetical protein